MAEALKQSDAGCDHEEPPTAAFLSSDKTLHVEIKHGIVVIILLYSVSCKSKII